MISVVICTYKRTNTLLEELECLVKQTHQDFEVLIIDGSGEDKGPYNAVNDFKAKNNTHFPIHFIESPKGLTRQRNVGLKHAKGNIVAFFDDDVTFGDDYLQLVAIEFAKSEYADVVGMTTYDINNYPKQVSLRFKLRRAFRIVPEIKPGNSDSLGRNVPISILDQREKPFEMKWLPGFCMIYRADKIEGLKFDEDIPTYGGEDFDFSNRAASKGRLIMLPHINISHNNSVENRPSNLRRVWETSFGVGRAFKKRKSGFADMLAVLYFPIAEFMVDLLFLIKSPSVRNFKAPFVKVSAYVSGYRSL